MASKADDTITEQAIKLEKKGEEVVHDLAVEDADSTDTNLRYMAYLRRITNVARAGSRYTAYTSDIGEAFRPVVPPYVVTAAYGISWAYLIGDVAFTTYKAREQGPSPLEAANLTEPTRLSMVAVKRSVFQGVASMALPAFTIHTAVKQSAKYFNKSTRPFARTWGPTITGLAIVPALPYLFDEVVEKAVDVAYEKIEHKVLVNPAVGSAVPPVVEPKREL